MRTLRLSLVGAVIALVVGGALAVGQSPSPFDPMRAGAVHIDFRVVEFFKEGTRESDGVGIVHERGTGVTLTFESRDPRLSGDVTYLANLDCFKDGTSVHTETYEIVNDGGSWFVASLGMEVPGQVYGDYVLFRGEGGYAGLSALLFVDGLRNTIDGVIFPGEMPPVQESVEPPAQ